MLRLANVAAFRLISCRLQIVLYVVYFGLEKDMEMSFAGSYYHQLLVTFRWRKRQRHILASSLHCMRIAKEAYHIVSAQIKLTASLHAAV